MSSMAVLVANTTLDSSRGLLLKLTMRQLSLYCYQHKSTIWTGRAGVADNGNKFREGVAVHGNTIKVIEVLVFLCLPCKRSMHK